MKTILSEEQELAICEYYSYPHGSNDTCSFFNIGHARLKKILASHGIAAHSAETLRRLNVENSQSGMLKAHGVRFASQMADHAKKCGETKLRRYGSKTFTNREKARETCLERYGAENPQQNEAIRAKTKETMLRKYGAESNVELKSTRDRCLGAAHAAAAEEKRKSTCLKRFGAPTNLITPEQRSKNRESNLENYGVESYAQTQECKDKIKRTCLERYGVDHYAKTAEFKLRIGSQLEAILDKSKQACLAKYGVEYYMQSEEFKQYAKRYFSANRDEIQSKAKAACQDKYGADCYFLSEDYRSKLPAIKALLAEKRAEIQEKSMNTKRRNGTFNSSKPEELFYEALIEKFGADNIVRQYKCASYPFNCDFYVKSRDLFIELNLS